MSALVTLLLLASIQAHSDPKAKRVDDSPSGPTVAICAGQGEEAGGSCVGCLLCCKGLTLTNSWLHRNYVEHGCNAPVLPGSGGRCVKCGDGKCDEANYENKCVCPADCK